MAKRNGKADRSVAEDRWVNRIRSSGTKPAADFHAHELNWRLHPDEQQAALEGLLDKVGWIQNVIISARTGKILDGHARVALALKRGDQTPVPFIEVDVSEEEEKLALAALDPISARAATDQQKLNDLPVTPNYEAGRADRARADQ